jgi:hypothetical protein
MDTCPICRARLSGATTCRRCRADLERVWTLEQRGQALTVAAFHALVQGDCAAAAHWLGHARRVHATPESRVLEQLVAAAGRPANADPVPTGEEDANTAETGQNLRPS